MREDMHAGWIKPDEERFAFSFCLVDEGQGVFENFIVDGFHALGVKRASVFDALLADFAPARLVRRIVGIRRPGVNHVAGPDLVLHGRRVIAMRWIFHRVEVIEIAKELIEAVHRWQVFVAITQMVLAELAGGVAHRLQGRRYGRSLRWHADGGSSLPYGREACADR